MHNWIREVQHGTYPQKQCCGPGSGSLTDRHHSGGSVSISIRCKAEQIKTIPVLCSRKFQYTVQNSQKIRPMKMTWQIKQGKLALLWIKVNKFSDFPTCVKLSEGSGFGSALKMESQIRIRIAINMIPIHNTAHKEELNVLSGGLEASPRKIFCCFWSKNCKPRSCSGYLRLQKNFWIRI